ncbi:ALA-interacting subunit 3-like [Glycine soja]|uniref:ALA-interacting subunit n=1 Tax=Glycine soja TaxID=3848 RepID=A0A445FF67_GLYSO|nr:ALA-interacting subunit 3-like [Glycine soja]KHN34676.1 ALA-interacting subunit 3 [Glycine soja]RZB47447.1 ALA-interacting subunit 3 [Glycine soja]
MSVENSSTSVSVAEGQSKNAMKPKYSRFSQQELHAWQPILTPSWAISIFTVIGLIFIPVGLASLFASESVVEVPFRYDDECLPPDHKNDAVAYIKDVGSNKTCTKKLTVKNKMKAPVYVYYQLDNFYQNHRRYVKSRDDKQLRSKAAENDVGSCSPEDYTPNDMGHKPIVPCGLIAWSLFNDTYKLTSNNKDLVINKKNIAWKSDQSGKFGSDVYPKNFQAGGLIGGARLNESLPLSEQEDLIVWMRTAALPTFRKLYGKIETDIEVNDVVLVIENNYNTYEFGGRKSIVLSTTTWVGGRNNFLGMAYILIGGISLLLAAAFLLLYVMQPRPLGDPSYLSWNKNPGSLR